jgi:hypothetical protein
VGLRVIPRDHQQMAEDVVRNAGLAADDRQGPAGRQAEVGGSAQNTALRSPAFTKATQIKGFCDDARGDFGVREVEGMLLMGPWGQRHTCGGAAGWPPRRGGVRLRSDARCAGAQAGSWGAVASSSSPTSQSTWSSSSSRRNARVSASASRARCVSFDVRDEQNMCSHSTHPLGRKWPEHMCVPCRPPWKWHG